MSLLQASTGPTSTLPPKPEAKTKPVIPPKPLPESDSLSREEGGSTATCTPIGKVKKIVDSFSQNQTTPTATGEQPCKAPTSSASEPSKVIKTAPAVKPRQSHGNLAKKEVDQAPPLPQKRRLLRQKADQTKSATSAGEEGNYVNVEVGRSAPDGKEVELELNVGGEVDGEHGPATPLTPCCSPGCSCACHFQRPGMKLMWVPMEGWEGEGKKDEVDGGEKDEAEWEGDRGESEAVVQEGETGEESEEEEEEEEAEEEEERGGEGESEADEEEDGSECSLVELEATRMVKFHHTLDVMLAENHRRRSDPGPPTMFSLLPGKTPQSPPIPPKHTHSPLARVSSSQDEEENIYEKTLMIEPPPQKNAPPASASCRELEIPFIRVRKPMRRTKLSPSVSEPTSEFQPDDVESAGSATDTPPAIPPRMPLDEGKSGNSGGSSSLTPSHRGGIALPQPTPEEWRSLRPLSPNGLAAGSLTPKRAPPSPPISPLLPLRAPPPLPKVDSKRLSSSSLQSLVQLKEKEETIGSEGEKEETEEEKRPVTLLRRGSSLNWESRLQDEPLYQTYRATVITKEIRRQTVCRNISKASVDFNTDWRARYVGTGTGAGTGTGTGNGLPRGAPVPGQSTLWQDLPAVRDSGVLEQLSPEECKYQESMFEVLTSEASYLRSLRVLTEHFLESRELEETLIIMDRKTLFSNILRVREVSERFLKDLEDRMDKDLVLIDICDIIHYHAQHNFPAYIDYVRNQIYQEKTYTALMNKNAQFAQVISRLQESPHCQRLPFMSFLLLPFQRITRIKMLIENILKRTKEKTLEEQTASKALDSVSKIIQECNTQVGKMKQVEELVHLSKTLEFDKLKAIPIISQTRYLEKKGELQEMSKGGTLFNMRAKFTPIHLFLFNDLLIIAAKKGAERFVVVDHAHRSLVQVEPLEEGASGASPYEHCFNLTLLENHQTRMVERLLKASSQSDMHRWMAAFPNPSNPDSNVEEVIYDDWDCPQVQCVEQYIAQQADELTLEPTEIINVIRKTNEGWYEGSRLSDGQKGWFPVGNVVEITNEHVRRRNLRERYRVMQAATIVANSKAR